MGTRRIPLIVCITGALLLGACGSDENKSSASTTPSSDSTDIVSDVTSTSGVTPATIAPAIPTTAATETTLSATPTTVVTGTTTAPRVVTSPSDNVKVGDSGDGVKQIQQALKDKGYQVTVDGAFGNQTATAVKAFQKKNGLKQDGIVGPKTWAKLSAAGSSGSADTTTTKA